MSLLGSVGGVLKGAVGGFISGGPMGAGIGAMSAVLPGGAKAYKSPQAFGRGKGLQLAAQQVGSTSGQYSAAPSARLTASPSSFSWSSAGPMSSLGFTNTTPSATPYKRSGKLAYSHYVVDPVTGRTYRVSDKTGLIIKPRQMNVLNGRAARRAIRRVKGARKMLQVIERSLPRARTHRSR